MECHRAHWTGVGRGDGGPTPAKPRALVLCALGALCWKTHLDLLFPAKGLSPVLAIEKTLFTISQGGGMA